MVSQSVLAPAPDSFDVEQTAVFLTNSSLTARLDPWTGDFCLQESCENPFVQLQLPAAQAANGTEVQVKQRAKIANMTEFNEYTRLTLMSDTFNVYLKGKGGLKYGSLPKTTVNYNKKVALQGLPPSSF